jgi:hypothetical protein
MTPKEQFKIALSMQADGSSQILVAMEQYVKEDTSIAGIVNRYKKVVLELESISKELK